MNIKTCSPADNIHISVFQILISWLLNIIEYCTYNVILCTKKWCIFNYTSIIYQIIDIVPIHIILVYIVWNVLGFKRVNYILWTVKLSDTIGFRFKSDFSGGGGNTYASRRGRRDKRNRHLLDVCTHCPGNKICFKIPRDEWRRNTSVL